MCDWGCGLPSTLFLVPAGWGLQSDGVIFGTGPSWTGVLCPLQCMGTCNLEAFPPVVQAPGASLTGCGSRPISCCLGCPDQPVSVNSMPCLHVSQNQAGAKLP